MSFGVFKAYNGLISNNSIRKMLLSSMKSHSSIGFIGLGQMGNHMANNLLQSGYDVIAYDLNHIALKEFQQKGGKVASSPKEIAEKSQSIVTMLPSSPHVEEAYLGENGIIHGLQKDALLIDSSTIDPNVSKRVSQKLSNQGATMVDAPVSGGVTGAEAATLTFMVGGCDDGFKQAKIILEKMGKNIVHCGGEGTGQVAKLCNNLALAIEMIAVSEAMNLGKSLGMDPKVLADIMNTSSSQCWSSSIYNPYPGILDNVPASRNYEGGFATVLMRKDLGLALDAARSVDASVPFTASAHQLYNLAAQYGYGKKDFGVILKFLQENK